MTTKVKIFNSISVVVLEKVINNWLDTVSPINIISVTQTENDEYGTVTIVIFYNTGV